ncbi:MAG TPA: heterodisulfide reductase-related iron-sulfur binding cluster [Rhizomicrobium sp.]
MRTQFSLAQLADPHIAEADAALRACVHCGICTASCPTYVLLGDERDSPRGRIVMMQKMLEQGGAPSTETVTHIDRCLSCLACRTVCPSGVDYQRLVDQSRVHIEKHYRRPLGERLTRWMIAHVLTRPNLTLAALRAARLFAPLAFLLPHSLRAMARRGATLKSSAVPGEAAPGAQASRRIFLLPGCVQQVIAPEIDAAMTRILARRGISLVPLSGAGCCGALSHHLGREGEAKAFAKHNIEAFERAGGERADGLVISATGCAAHLADYEHLFLDDPDWQDRAGAFSAKHLSVGALLSYHPLEGRSKFAAANFGVGSVPEAQRDHPSPNEFANAHSFDPPSRGGCGEVRVAYHVPCSQQHGLRQVGDGGVLRAAGFDVVAIPEGHLCCGSAGSYSLLQPEIAHALRERKLANIGTVQPDVIATSNIGCLQHLSGPDAPPVVHLAELLDWAEGGPTPRPLTPLATPVAAN